MNYLEPDACRYFDWPLERMGTATEPGRRQVRFTDGSQPVAARCHDNVDRWVSENPGCSAVRGWAVLGGGAGHWRLTLHSVIQTPDRQLLDITYLDGPVSFIRRPVL